MTRHYADGYRGWPVAPRTKQHPVRGSFLDPRSGIVTGGDGYHPGVDVAVRDDRPEAGAPPGRTHRVFALEGGRVWQVWRQPPPGSTLSGTRRTNMRKVLGVDRRGAPVEGPPTRVDEQPARRLNAWPDFEIRLAGRGLLLRARMSGFNEWWHDEQTWQGEPMGPALDWIAEDRRL